MQSIEALETIMTQEVSLLHALSITDSISIDQENKTISLTYNYDKDNIDNIIVNIQESLDKYILEYETTQDEILYIKDFIKWLRQIIEQVEMFKGTL